MPDTTPPSLTQLTTKIKKWAAELGFQQCGITDCDLHSEKERYKQWISAGYHGEMTYLNNHLDKRFSADSLLPGTQRIICVRMNYLPPNVDSINQLDDEQGAYVSRYTLGRDYHKLIRQRLTQLGKRIDHEVGTTVFRAFVDSAPILERPLAEKAGIGWRGKHTLILNREAGSMFFLGELLIDIPLPIDEPTSENHCGKCTACLDVCPTQAFPQPYVLDARKCISYLTIELKGSIPVELRAKMGNRIFGCDDCQLICPWNRFADFTQEQDFHPRQKLDKANLVELFNWDEATFLKKTEGSAIRRTGHIGWLRNIAIALGNSSGGDSVITALKEKLTHESDLVKEHTHWALEQLTKRNNDIETLPIHLHPRRNKITL